ncbi:hypothetical protein C8R44DRAFT_880888 [Mycena epipterygia]|nr:hypothetical protein C8R44DRAFT_880888 [Mycena epipterygia]
MAPRVGLRDPQYRYGGGYQPLRVKANRYIVARKVSKNGSVTEVKDTIEEGMRRLYRETDTAEEDQDAVDEYFDRWYSDSNYTDIAADLYGSNDVQDSDRVEEPADQITIGSNVDGEGEDEEAFHEQIGAWYLESECDCEHSKYWCSSLHDLGNHFPIRIAHDDCFEDELKHPEWPSD